jgi:vacuolar-type H+-ATPase subunit C/Vma6
MKFLQETEDRGYPADYLLARIHGRRVFLFSDWENMLFRPDISEHLLSTHYGEFISAYSAEGIRMRYLQELQWIYFQMNNRLREVFAPYFILSELNTLLICLRYKSVKGRNTEIERVLLYSILDEKIKKILRTEEDVSSSIMALQRRSGPLFNKLPDVNAALLKDGLKGAEQVVIKSVVRYILSKEMHPLIKRFFTAVINAKNLLLLFKHVKWEIAGEPLLIEGGDINVSSLRRAMKSRDVQEVLHLIYKEAGFYTKEPDASRIEGLLNRRMAKLTMMMKRESHDIGFILHYLWQCHIEERNLSLMFYGSNIDKTIIKEELVY